MYLACSRYPYLKPRSQRPLLIDVNAQIPLLSWTQTAAMASASPFALEDPSGFCPWIIVVGDSLAIVGSTLTVLYIYRQISIARHFQKEQLKHKSNPNTLEETRVSKTAKRFQPCQILTTNLLILHAALWAIVRSTLHLTFTIKQIRDYDAFVITASNIYQVEWKRSDMKDLWGGTQTFTWGTLLFTAIPTLWMVRQFFPKAFPPRARALSLLWDILLVFGFAILWILSSCPTTASLGVSLVMLASVNLIMASLLSSMLEIQRHATRAKVQGVSKPL